MNYQWKAARVTACLQSLLILFNEVHFNQATGEIKVAGITPESAPLTPLPSESALLESEHSLSENDTPVGRPHTESLDITRKAAAKYATEISDSARHSVASPGGAIQRAARFAEDLSTLDLDMDSTAQRSTEDAAAHELKQGLEAWDAATTRQPDEEQMKTVYSDDTYQQAPDEHEVSIESDDNNLSSESAPISNFVPTHKGHPTPGTDTTSEVEDLPAQSTTKSTAPSSATPTGALTTNGDVASTQGWASPLLQHFTQQRSPDAQPRHTSTRVNRSPIADNGALGSGTHNVTQMSLLGSSDHFYPYGTQENVSEAILRRGNWQLCYNAPYINDHDDQVAAKEQVAGPGSRSSAAASSKDGYFMRCGGEHILIGARHGAEMGTLAVAAAGLRAEVLKVTAGKGEARLHNGAYWYHVPGGSVGFAESEVVQVAPWDMEKRFWRCERRVSWQIGRRGEVKPGGRAGCTVLDSEIVGWHKVVYHYIHSPVARQDTDHVRMATSSGAIINHRRLTSYSQSTAAPTNVPTVGPTATPTSVSPTSSPSVSPTTAAPSVAPTMPPTTRHPTVPPTTTHPITSSPTPTPTSQPTSTIEEQHLTAGEVYWAHTIPALASTAYAGTTDANGNVYLTGMFWSRATFGTGYTATVLSSSGNEDIYVAKLSSMGTILWAIKAGGASTDIGYGIATSAGTSDVFVAGWFQSTMATFGSTVLTGGASGDWDAFLMKVSNLGTISWVLRSVGPGNEEVISVEADPSGSGGAIMTGDFSGTMTFGSGYSAHVLVSKGYEDMFTLKVSATGTVVWAMQGGGSSGDDIGSGVAIETSTGNVFVTGWMESSVSTFGATAIANRGSSGSSDVFVLKASSQGTVLWVQTFGGTANDFGRRIQADAYGDVVLGGCFHSTYATFGGESITAHTGAGGDVFVAKVSGSGTVGWTAHAGGSSDECAYGIVMNATTRDVYVTGFTQSSRATFGDKVLTPYGYQDVFVLKLSVMGTTMWAMRAGGSRTSQSNHDQGRDVALDSDGNVYVMGFTAPPAQFGSPYSCTNGNAGNSASGWLYGCSTDLEFVVDAGSPSVSDLVGMRFTNIQIPQGAYVLTANIEFTVDETSYSPGTITFHAEAADNAAQSRYNSAKLSYRTKTSASATWALPAGPPYIGGKESTSNIAAVIQEVVLRPGWYPGNAILIIASDQTARRVYESYDGAVGHYDTSRAPLLTISYSTFPMTLPPTLNPTQAPTLSPTMAPTATPVCFWVSCGGSCPYGARQSSVWSCGSFYSPQSQPYCCWLVAPSPPSPPHHRRPPTPTTAATATSTSTTATSSATSPTPPPPPPRHLLRHLPKAPRAPPPPPPPPRHLPNAPRFPLSPPRHPPPPPSPPLPSPLPSQPAAHHPHP
ncbi:hypothetical protein CYMTET_19232 [Cymbomonas tetramitiformis]|uniref:Uncharacterized protein n=1 Tax=Cymbomonas tetramitiformis TaxID=36881 RepID=A0AAE0G6H0_9CHLO|nr:hypothetical protein CYMTET_19232 [Cymbomonas tetramitiformis]